MARARRGAPSCELALLPCPVAVLYHSPIHRAAAGGGGGVDVVSSGSVERPADTAATRGGVGGGAWLEGAGQGLHNPLDWNSVPSALREQFPHWKEGSSSVSKPHSNNLSEGMGWSVSMVGALSTCECMQVRPILAIRPPTTPSSSLTIPFLMW